MIFRCFKTFALLLLLNAGMLKAQSAVIVAGGEASGSNGKISYAIGQVADGHSPGGGFLLTEGVVQPVSVKAVTGLDDDRISLGMTAYPNPVSNMLTLKISDMELSDMTVRLYDLQGNTLLNREITHNTLPISVAGLSSSVYVLKVFKTDKPIKVFKVIVN